uniref:Peptidase M12B propeptide domain-containing protein n=1 Tax=Anopheles christyi TaxID=43041 RepID=A0A182KAB3_9DIPT
MNERTVRRCLRIFFTFLCVKSVFAFPEQGKWDFVLTKRNTYIPIPKSLYDGFSIFVQGELKVAIDQHRLSHSIKFSTLKLN